jgi:hypothetical protein
MSFKAGALLALVLLISGTFISVTRVDAAETQYVPARIVNQLDWSSAFALNSSVYPLNSTLTVNFWLESVRGLTAWQLCVSWNDSVIHFAKAWVPGVSPYPGSNVFTDALNQGAQPIVPEVSTEFDPYTNVSYVLYGMTTNPLSSITKPGEALMCSMNFTVGVNVTGKDTIGTNISIVASDPSAEFSSYVIFYPAIHGPLISADPATVLLYGPDAAVISTPVPETTLTILTVDASTGDSVSGIPIAVTWQGGQNSSSGYSEHGARTFDLGRWAGEVNITAGESEYYYSVTEPPFNVHAGPQTYTVGLVKKSSSLIPPWLIVVIAVAVLAALVGVAVYVSRKRKVRTLRSGSMNARKPNRKRRRKVT